MSRHTTHEATTEAIKQLTLAETLRAYIQRHHPNISNEQLYEAVVDVYADVVRENNAHAVEQVQSSLSTVFGDHPIPSHEQQEREANQEIAV